MIAPESLLALMRGEAPHAVLDLRERGAYQRGHIFGTTSLPRRLLEWRLATLVTARATPIVLCDEDGALADRARPTLAAMGYADVRPLAGGLRAWRAAGRSLVQGVNVPSKVFGEQLLHGAKTPELTPQELAAEIARGADLFIVDTRTPEEYRRGCVPGAVNVPNGELPLRIADLVPRPETTIVVHCGGRTRSYVGAETLRRLGLPNRIVALANGTMGWVLAGLELEREAARWPSAPSARARALGSRIAKRVAAEDAVPLVSPQELAGLWERRERENVSILDVRTAEEYAAGHVAGATWAPGGQAVQTADEFIAVRAASIVLVCDGFARSVVTASWLRRMGFPHVAVLAGGLGPWQEAGGAIETGHPSPAPFGYETARASVDHVRPGPLGDATVIDVDQSDAYARGHVPGAAWICRSRLEGRIERVAPDQGQPVVVTCADGRQSALAAATLGDLGYRHVRVLDGGTRAWAEAGLALETGPTRLADEADDLVLRPADGGREAMEAYLRWEEALDEEGRSPHELLPGREAHR